MPSPNKPEYTGPLLSVLAYLASSRGSRLTKIRLVKFLYLFDLFWAQSQKRTFTNWPWAFVHYGPYCRESTNAIDLAEKTGYLVAEAYESRYRDEDFRLYGPGSRITEADVDRLLNDMPIYVSSRLQGAVKRWYDDTYGLLDYVYFHTGPMANAHPEETLSFANEEMLNMEELRPVKMLALTNNKKRTLQEAIKKIAIANQAPGQPSEIFDQEYFDFISNIAGAETETGISGVAKLSFERSSDD
ncbi:hypothetical protein HZA56_01065 [Candidatus Poribacteria bacterium]|nr:hypothetical protein [Candidatus Poribacteria bacterium]